MRSRLLPFLVPILCCLFYIGHAVTVNGCFLVAVRDLPCYDADINGYAECIPEGACLPIDDCPESSPWFIVYAFGGPCNGAPVCDEAASATDNEWINGSGRNFYGYCDGGWYMCGTYVSEDCFYNYLDYQDECPFC